MGVTRTAIEDDQLGIYTPLFEEMGYGAATHPDELVFGLLKNGHTTNCFDGQSFFDTDHPVYAEVDGTGAVSLVSNNLVPRSGCRTRLVPARCIPPAQAADLSGAYQARAAGHYQRRQ